MTLYELLLFVHIFATVIWVGSGLFSLVLAISYDRDSDESAIRRFLLDQERLAVRLFVPSSLAVVVFGIALVIESDAWAFDQLWIVLGLIGYVATFVTGLFFIKPRIEAIGADMEREGGGLTPRLRTDIRKLMVTARTDQVVLAVVIFDMVVKPTGDDAGVLIAMAAVVIAGVGYIAARVRAIEGEASPAAAPAS